MSRTYSVFAERRINGVWTLIGDPSDSPCYDCPRPPDALWISSHSELITILCGHQVICCDVDNTGVETIAPPRGLPDDLSPVLRAWAELEIRERLAHNPSWLLAREILDFDWHTPKILYRGYVMAEMARHFDPDPETPFPEEAWGGWYDAVPNPHALERRLQIPGNREEDFVYIWPRPGTVEVHWCESHYQAVGHLDEFFAELRELGPTDTVRLVFWIDD